MELVEGVVGDDLVDAFDEACKAGIVIEEPGGYYRFNHALVRQSLLAELASVRRMRLHQSIATTLEAQPGADDELLAELAYHYFECAWAGNAAKAVDYCRRAADQAMARLGYEAAADLYDRALHALEEIDDELPDRDDQAAGLLVARCEALLAAGDVTTAAGAVSQLQRTTTGSARLAAWATCFDGELSMLVHPERLDDIEAALGLAAAKLAELDDAAGEAKAHTVRAACLARLGRVGDCEIALDDALTAARRAGEHRRVNAVLAGAPLAALWGPNPVPRAGGRCLDVVRLLRITTDSPAVEATSTRCQAVLEAFRGRAEAARRMIDSARRTVTELGLRHALLEVEQFAGIVELVVDDPAAAEPHLRLAYNGFRRMGLDADTAETAALLGRACLALDQEADADELCTESERLAGNALKPAMAWRMLRAQLLSCRGDHDEARQVAEAAVALAERTDALVDHGDACLALATVLRTAGDAAGSRAAAERAVDLYERKGAAALAEKARSVLGKSAVPPTPAVPEDPNAEPVNACVQAIRRGKAVVDRAAWDEFEELCATDIIAESRRKMVGFTQYDLPNGWVHQSRRLLETGDVRLNSIVVIAVRGERLALTRMVLGSADVSPGAAVDEILQLFGIDEEGRIALQVSFDVDDMDAALAELDATHGRFEEEAHRQGRKLTNAASQQGRRLLAHLAAGDQDALAQMLADNFSIDDRRRVVGSGVLDGRDAGMASMRAIAEVFTTNPMPTDIAIRGRNLLLGRLGLSGRNEGPDAFLSEMLTVNEINDDDQLVAIVAFDLDDFDAAIAELDRRYLAGEAAAHSHTWSLIAAGHAAVNRRELPPMTADPVSIDHRRGAAFAPGELLDYFRAGWDVDQSIRTYVEEVHRLSDLGAVCTHVGHGNSREGFGAEWRGIDLLTVDGDAFNRCEVFDEADLDVALARFDELSRPVLRPENAASQMGERFLAYFAASDWDAMAKMLADNVCNEDHRQVVGGEVRHGRDAQIADMRATADLWSANVTRTVIAIRGKNLALMRIAFSRRDEGPDAFLTEVHIIDEIDVDGRIASIVVFDVDDFDAAIAELDARYLAGEAKSHSRTWSAITHAYATIDRHEFPSTTPAWVNVDHRQGRAFAPGNMIPFIRATWDVAPESRVYIEAVHRLSDRGAVVTNAMSGSSREGFDAEWREVFLLTFEGEDIDRAELFDEADLDAAIAKFDQLIRPARRPENTASRVADAFQAYYAAGDWQAMAEVLVEDYSSDDRRRVVGSGVRHGRDAHLADMRTRAELWLTSRTSTVMATRGERLALLRVRMSDPDQGREAFVTELLVLDEVNADERLAAGVAFDLDDFDAAITELDARYLAGEAGAHAQVWSVVTGAYAAFNRHERPPTTPDWVNIDHRRVTAFPSGALPAYMHATWELTPNANMYIETVHRLTSLGLVVTRVVKGTSRDGFDAEWREIGLSTVKGDRINRSELFDEADIDAAIARLDELSRPAPQLENAAIRLGDRYLAYFAAGDRDAMAEILADNVVNDDRRRLVGSGIADGRNAQMANTLTIGELWSSNVTRTVIATRGENLALARLGFSRHSEGSDVFLTEALSILEIDDEKVVAILAFDLDDFEGAFAELDARYLAGEAAAFAHTWAVITREFATLNRRELPATTADWVNVDHRRGASFAPGEMFQLLGSAWDRSSDLSNFIDAVHRLNDFGGVITHVARETSQEGFHAEWRVHSLFTLQGEMINRCEVFDEGDLDAALAKFDQLSRPAPRLQNAASRADDRLFAQWAAHKWDAMAEILADSSFVDDRRRVVNAGFWQGRDVVIANLQALEAGADITSPVIATRGERLALTRIHSSNRDQRHGEFGVDMLSVVEINVDNQLAAHIMFDPDDIDAALEELDARYLAGEASAHARTWSVITGGVVGLNRRELSPTTPDWVNIDHRLGTAFAPGDAVAYVRAGWELGQDVTTYTEAVHRLNDLGAVFTTVAHGTSQVGFAAEWRTLNLMTVDGEMISRSEVFDEADLDVALARFDELSRPAPQLENAASRVTERFLGRLAAGDWDAIAETLVDDFSQDDRRRVVGAGVRHGRDAEIMDLRAIADLSITNVTSTVIATRGEHLALMRVCFSFRDQGPEAFLGELLGICEINADERIVADVSFDLDDIAAAIAELDARYLAGEAAAYAHTWTVFTNQFAALNRRELPATTPDWVNIDHRRGASFAPGEMFELLGAAWNRASDLSNFVEAVHRLNDFGGVITHVARETSQEGFDAEWRVHSVFTVEGDMVSRCEVFDEADIDAAIATFDQLSQPTLGLENRASRVWERFQAFLKAEDWAEIAKIAAEDVVTDDRRRVIGAGVQRGRAVNIASLRASADIGIGNVKSTVIATRGERLLLDRVHYSGGDQTPEPFQTEMIRVLEIDTDERICAAVFFDADDGDAAFEELDARYLAGEAAVHARTWSLMAGTHATLNRHKMHPTTPDWVNIDHRRGIAFAPGDIVRYAHDTFDDMPDAGFHIVAVHRLSDLGAVITQAIHGTSRKGLEAEWQHIALYTFEGDLANRCEIFDEADLDAALARFDELQPQSQQLKNAASVVVERFWSCFATRDWVAMAETMADEFRTHDRRRVVNAGVLRGRAVHITNMRAMADVGFERLTSTVLATRGHRLALIHIHASLRDAPPAEVIGDVLSVIHIDVDNRLVSNVVFDATDIDAAFEELDAGFLAGEAAVHSRTWMAITQVQAAYNRHEIPPTTEDLANVDHRRGRAFAPGDSIPFIVATWNVIPDVKGRIEAVHRLTNFGAVVTEVMTGSSRDGFDAEWREIGLFAFDGDLICRFELFDETDLDAALARFDESHPRSPRLENAASQAVERYWSYFAARNWDALAETMADAVCTHDRRRVVNAGVVTGRAAHIANMRAVADVGFEGLKSTVIATRGHRLVLIRIRSSVQDSPPGEVTAEMLSVIGVDADNKIDAAVMFDSDDLDAAFEELDARYLAGEAAEHEHMWSVIAAGYASLNRHELPASASDCISIDHRPLVAIEARDMAENIRDLWRLTPDHRIYVEAVHRLNNVGAVVTHVASGTSDQGFDAEWRVIEIFVFGGDLISRVEMFDEADLAAALARFDELDRPAS